MKIAVYDTYYTSASGHLMHFDVLVEDETPENVALDHARTWLNEIGENGENLQQERCRYCHSENASDDLTKHIREHGFYILQMEGCPNPLR